VASRDASGHFAPAPDVGNPRWRDGVRWSIDEDSDEDSETAGEDRRVRINRHLNLLDLVVVIVTAVAIFLPPRETYALDAAKGTDADRRALAAAEARTRAHPEDGAHAQELARALTAAGHLDWAVEAAAEASTAAGPATRWRALLATSVAYAERLDAPAALAWA
jgi:hypothetical protein